MIMDLATVEEWETLLLNEYSNVSTHNQSSSRIDLFLIINSLTQRIRENIICSSYDKWSRSHSFDNKHPSPF